MNSTKIFWVFMLFSVKFVTAQTNNSLHLFSEGGKIESTGSVYTLGEVITGNINTEQYKVSQGFLQTFYESTPVNAPKKQVFVHLFPNPSSSDLYYSLDPELLQSRFKVLNQVGSVQLAGVFEDLEGVLEVTNLLPGIYYLILENEAAGTPQYFKFVRI